MSLADAGTVLVAVGLVASVGIVAALKRRRRRRRFGVVDLTGRKPK